MTVFYFFHSACSRFATLTKTLTKHRSIKITKGVLSAMPLALLTACTPADKSPSEKAQPDIIKGAHSVTRNSDTQKPIVYASTNVWGAVAQAVGGEHVNVIVGVNEPTQDPHDYQASAQDKLSISKAKLVLVNGGGYDDWAISLAQSVNPQPMVLNAVTLSGFNIPNASLASHTPPHEPSADFNEHVFYSLDTASKVATAVANQLTQSDPSHHAQYSQNLHVFNQQITKLNTQAHANKSGKTAFFTEPVVGYLLTDMGIQNVTPAAFIAQAETDAGVSAKVLQDSKSVLANKQANVLILNAQTEDATSKILFADAKAANIPVVNVYETLPAPLTAESKGNAYIEFMQKAIDDLQNAFNKWANLVI